MGVINTRRSTRFDHEVKNAMTQGFLREAGKAVVKYHHQRLGRWAHIYDEDDLYQEGATRLAASNRLEGADKDTTRAAVCYAATDLARRIQAGTRGYGRVMNVSFFKEDHRDYAEVGGADCEPNHEIAIDFADEMSFVRRKMEIALSFIPPKLAHFVRIRFFEDKTVKEIAADLNMSIDAVDALVRRGVKALREYSDDIVDGVSC